MGIFRKNITSFSDEQLVELLAENRKNEALTELHSRYAKRILGFFLKMNGGDVERAQDFTQDLFIRLLEKHKQFDSKRKFYTWIFTIASNMCKTEFRKPIMKRLSDDDYELNQSAKWNDNSLDKVSFRLALDIAVDKLGDQHKLTFVLRYIEELTIKEIAEMTDVATGTVKSRLFYATKKVASDIQEFNPKNEQFGESFSDGTNNMINT